MVLIQNPHDSKSNQQHSLEGIDIPNPMLTIEGTNGDRGARRSDFFFMFQSLWE